MSMRVVKLSVYLFPNPYFCEPVDDAADHDDDSLYMCFANLVYSRMFTFSNTFFNT